MIPWSNLLESRRHIAVFQFDFNWKGDRVVEVDAPELSNIVTVPFGLLMLRTVDIYCTKAR